MGWFKLSTVYSFLVGVVYAVHSVGFPIGAITVKPYQLVSMALFYRTSRNKLIWVFAYVLVFHSVLILITEGGLSHDSAAYVFVVMLLVYSCIMVAEFERKFMFVIAGVSTVYFIGILLYVYALVFGDYVNIHKDVESRSELVNTVAAFVFFDGKSFRYNGYALDPNFYSFYLNVFFGIALFLSYTKNLKLPLYFVLVTALSVLLTLSRIGVASFLLLLCAWGWVGSGHVKRFGLLIAMFAVVLSISALGLYMGRSLFSFHDASDSRFSVWAYHVSNVLAGDYTILGRGLTFDIVRYSDSYTFYKSTHNTILYLLYCLGLPLTLFLVFLWLVRFIILVFTLSRDRSVILLALHLVYALSALTLDLLFTVPFYLYMFFCFRYPVKGSRYS